MSIFYTPPPIVIDGTVAYAAHVNDISAETNAAFDAVESFLGGVAPGAEIWAALAEKWANNPVDVAVEPGLFSAYHWSVKASDQAAAAVVSASAASSSAGESAGSASTASTQAGNAATSAATASNAAAAAGVSEDNAYDSEVASAASAAAAAQSAEDAEQAGDIAYHTNATGTAVHGLGNASTKTVGSTYAGTTDQLMKTGAYGLGAGPTYLADPIRYTTSNALNNIASTEFGSIGSGNIGTVGGPSGLTGRATVLTIRYSDQYADQTLVELGASAADQTKWHRAYNYTTGWTAWRMVYDQQSSVGTVSYDALNQYPTGALIEVGSSVSGDWTLYADGTVMQWGSSSFLASGKRTIGFPVACVQPPLCLAICHLNSAELPVDLTVGSEVPTNTQVIFAKGVVGIRTFSWLVIGRWY